MRPRAFVVLCATVGALVFGGSTPAQAATPSERNLISRINREHSERGIHSVRSSWRLNRVAKAWSKRMSGEGRVSHDPRLGDKVRGWNDLAANVGLARSVSAAHRLFMRSRYHRDNVLGPFRCVGVGVVKGRKGYYVTEIFSSPCPG